MEDFRTLLGGTPEINEICDLWYEYEEYKTPVAILVKDLDKYEMIVQAFEYEKSGKKRLEEFFTSTHGKFKHLTVMIWVEMLYKQRQEYWGQNN